MVCLWGGPLKHDAAVSGVTFSPDGHVFLTWEQDRSARLWRAEDGTAVCPPLMHEGTVLGAAFSPNGSLILTWSADGMMRLWHTADGTLASVAFKAPLNAAFSPDGARIFTWDYTHLWEADITGVTAAVPSLHYDSWVRGATFSHDDEMILVSFDGVDQLWRSADGTAEVSLDHPFETVTEGIFLPGNDRILTHTWSRFNSNPIIRLWRTVDGTEAISPIQLDRISNVSFSSDGSRMLTQSDNGEIWLYHMTDAPAVPIPLKGRSQWSGGRFSPDGNLIVTWSNDGAIQLWRSADGRSTILPIKHAEAVLSATFSPDGRLLLTSSADGIARLWHTADGTSAGPPLNLNSGLRDASFSPDSRLILTVSPFEGYGSIVRLWRVTDGTLVVPDIEHSVFGIEAVFSPNGRLFLTRRENGQVRLWHAVDGTPAAPLLNDDNIVNGAAFSPDGRLLLTWGEDGVARLWNPDDGTLAVPPFKHGNAVSWATFGRDGRRILLMDESDAQLWDLHSDDDFPKKYLPLLVEVMTGTAMDDSGNVTALSPEVWWNKRAEYIQIAEQHLITCQYKDANLYLQQKQLWETSEPSSSNSPSNPQPTLNRWRAQELIEQGAEAARDEDIQDALARFTEANTLDPALQFDPQTEVNYWRANELLDLGQTSRPYGTIQEALVHNFVNNDTMFFDKK